MSQDNDLELQKAKDQSCRVVNDFEWFFGSYVELEKDIINMGYYSFHLTPPGFYFSGYNEDKQAIKEVLKCFRLLK